MKKIAQNFLLLLLPGVVTFSAMAQENCTMVMGFSQTADWYLAPADRNGYSGKGEIFESIVDDGNWQLKWGNGAGVNVYANPDAGAWSSQIISPCLANSDAPNRIVYMISGPHGENVDVWSADIEIALDNIREKIPSAEIIALQPVVGAPEDAEGDECHTTGTTCKSLMASHTDSQGY